MEQQATKSRIESSLKASSHAEIIKHVTWECSNNDSAKQGNRADGGQDENPVEDPTGRESRAIRQNQFMVILRHALSNSASFKAVFASDKKKYEQRRENKKEYEQRSEERQLEERCCQNQDTRGRRASELRNKKRSIEKLHGMSGPSQLNVGKQNEDQAEHNIFEGRRQPEENV
jgi:hypothetical protein